MQVFDPEKVKSRRKAAGLTQAQAAKAAGLTQGRWSELESGQRCEELTLRTLGRIAKALDCRVEELLGGDES